MGTILDFQPRQIVFLDHNRTRLYAEVIDVIPSRQRGWLRPLMLLVAQSTDAIAPAETLTTALSFNPEQLTLYDLRQASDLLCPLADLQPALDIEVIPWLAQLSDDTASPGDLQVARQQFHQFLAQRWQTPSASA